MSNLAAQRRAEKKARRRIRQIDDLSDQIVMVFKGERRGPEFWVLVLRLAADQLQAEGKDDLVS